MAEEIDDATRYESIISSIMYAVIGTKPNLAYTITMLSQFSSYTTKANLVAVHRVFHYLQGIIDW